MNIYVQPVGSSAEPVRITAEKDRDIADYFWKGSDRVVYLKDIGGDENDHVVVVDRRGGEPKDVTPFPGVQGADRRRAAEFPDRMLVGLNQRVKEVFDVYDLDLATGKLTLVAENPGNITAWGADHAGQIRYAVATDGVNNTYLYRDDPTAPFKPVLTTIFRDSFAPQFFTADNKQALRGIEPRPRQGRDRARRPRDRQGREGRLRARRRRRRRRRVVEAPQARGVRRATRPRSRRRHYLDPDAEDALQGARDEAPRLCRSASSRRPTTRTG